MVIWEDCYISKLTAVLAVSAAGFAGRPWVDWAVRAEEEDLVAGDLPDGRDVAELGTVQPEDVLEVVRDNVLLRVHGEAEAEGGDRGQYKAALNR